MRSSHNPSNEQERATNEQELATQSSGDLDHARDLVAMILEFVSTDDQQLSRFLKGTSFKLGDARELAESPLFMLSVLDTTVKDDVLLRALQEREQISLARIEMTQARLAFYVAAQLTR
jgi:hypothetical protein